MNPLICGKRVWQKPYIPRHGGTWKQRLSSGRDQGALVVTLKRETETPRNRHVCFSAGNLGGWSFLENGHIHRPCHTIRAYEAVQLWWSLHAVTNAESFYSGLSASKQEKTSYLVGAVITGLFRLACNGEWVIANRSKCQEGVLVRFENPIDILRKCSQRSWRTGSVCDAMWDTAKIVMEE